LPPFDVRQGKQVIDGLTAMLGEEMFYFLQLIQSKSHECRIEVGRTGALMLSSQPQVALAAVQKNSALGLLSQALRRLLVTLLSICSASSEYGG